MNLKINWKISLLLVPLLVILGLLIKSKLDFRAKSTELNKQLMAANFALGKAETRFGYADQKIVQLDKKLRDSIRESNAQITRYGELKAKYNTLVKKKGKIKTRVIYREGKVVETKKKLFRPGKLYQAESPTRLRPVNKLEGGHSDFRIDIDSEVISEDTGDTARTYMRIGYDLHIKFQGQIIETIYPSGAISHYFKMFELDDKGRRVGEIEVTDFVVVVDDRTHPKFYWWAPHIDVGVVTGADLDIVPHVGGSIGVSLSGYGLTKDDLSWRFLRISGDFNTDVSLGLTPVLYNFGEVLPLFSNIWVGPHISKGLNSGWTLGVFFGASL